MSTESQRDNNSNDLMWPTKKSIDHASPADSFPLSPQVLRCADPPVSALINTENDTDTDTATATATAPLRQPGSENGPVDNNPGNPIKELINTSGNIDATNIPTYSKKRTIEYSNEGASSCVTPILHKKKRKLDHRKERENVVVPPTATKVEDTSTAAFLPHQIQERVKLLFPSMQDEALQKPCILGRLFACFTLHLDTQTAPTSEETETDNNIKHSDNNHNQSIFSTPAKKKPSTVSTPMTTRRRRKIESLQAFGLQNVQPLMPFIQSLVELELVTLAVEQGPINSNDAKTPMKRKKSQLPPSNRHVAFCGVDGSSTRPPVDTTLGSQSHQDTCIGQLSCVLRHASSLPKEAETSLTQLISFLKELSEPYLDSCARSLFVTNYPKVRFLKPAKLYSDSFQVLLDRIKSSKKEPSNNGRNKPPLRSLLWERRLTHLCAQAIRYRLRRILNPLPDRAQFEEDRIADVVKLEAPDDQEQFSHAVEDVALASLVSNAFRRLLECWGLEIVVQKDLNDIDLSWPKEFCSSSYARNGLGSKNNKVKIEENGWNILLDELAVASQWRAAFEAAQFLLNLWTLPSFSQTWSSHHKTEWTKIHEHAKILQNFPHARSSLDDHLVYLCLSRDEMENRMSYVLEKSRKPAEACALQLNAMVGRFKLGMKRKGKIDKKYPRLAELETAWIEWQRLVTFPIVADEKGP